MSPERLNHVHKVSSVHPVSFMDFTGYPFRGIMPCSMSHMHSRHSMCNHTIAQNACYTDRLHHKGTGPDSLSPLASHNLRINGTTSGVAEGHLQCWQVGKPSK